jgi:Fe2+ transport system protein FeoA
VTPPSSSFLHELPLGAPAIVRSVDCDRLVRRRLFELGLLPGTRLEVIRRAPLGDPLELSLRGYRLSIRAEEARAIGVERVGRA